MGQTKAMNGLTTYLLKRIEAAGSHQLLHGNSRCFREAWSGAELSLAIKEFAAGLMSLGVEHGQKVGLIADNADFWLIADLACLSIGAVDVPRAADTSPDEVAFVLKHSQCKTVIVESRTVFQRLQASLAQCQSIGTIIVLDGEQPGTPGFDEILEMGRGRLAQNPNAVSDAMEAIKPSDLATIVYTSGTTGNPKGVMLSHQNLLHNASILPDFVNFDHRDSYLSFLPTWHTFERAIEYALLAGSSSIVYSSKSALRKDFIRVKPTILAGVPRIWESMISAVVGKIERAGGFKKRLIDSLSATSRRHATRHRIATGKQLDDDFCIIHPSLSLRLRSFLHSFVTLPQYWLCDRLLYSKVRKTLGGRVRIIVSGGGALPPHVDEFFNTAKIPLLNGYGLTETAPVLSVRMPKRNILTTAGQPLPLTKWRVMDEEGQAILSKGEKGVLWVKGPQVMQGYFENSEATKAVLTDDGWFCTGDLAVLSNEDDVIICGRAKDTIVLRGGENVEPANIEDEINRSPLIEDCIVVGHTQKQLAALLIPDLDALRHRLERPTATPAELTSDSEVTELLHAEIKSLINAENGYRVFERVPRIAILSEPFSVERGTLTSTLKKRRAVIESRHADVIQTLFADDGPSAFTYGSSP